MKNSSNKLIEDIIRQKLQKDEKIVEVLMETLSIGKESAYRRLRGEVPYSFDDIMKISARFNFSIDSVIGKKMSGTALINANIIEVSEPVESYRGFLNSQYHIYKELNKSPFARAHLAFNLIPYVFYSSYYTLSKFRLFRWLHQMNNTNTLISFNKVDFPESLWKLHNEMIAEYELIPEAHYVFDKDLFLTQIKDIILFKQLGLIDREDLITLKKELLLLLEDIQRMTSIMVESNKKRMLYVANVSFESSYLYFEADNYHVSGLRILGIGVVTTQDEWICAQQKKWIESLKRYSTLISISGEVDRFTFINRQKDYINMLDQYTL